MSLSVLIVDDSKLARALLKDALPKNWDVDIREATDGKEALIACRERKVDLMFLDLTMPEVDGYQVLKALQAEDSMPFVIVVTADIQPKARERVLALGAKAFLGKCITPEDISRVLEENGFL